jgi:hypothetical protein
MDVTRKVLMDLFRKVAADYFDVCVGDTTIEFKVFKEKKDGKFVVDLWITERLAFLFTVTIVSENSFYSDAIESWTVIDYENDHNLSSNFSDEKDLEKFINDKLKTPESPMKKFTDLIIGATKS